MPFPRLALAGAVATVAVGLGGVQLLPGTAPHARAEGLIGYKSCADLLEHYRSELERSAATYSWGREGGLPSPMAAGRTSTADSAAGAAESVGSGPTGTNVQEQGVDEPDTVKLRDGRLVVLTGTILRILSAQPEPRVLGQLSLGVTSGQELGGYAAGELLLVGDRAVVVLSGWRQENIVPESDSSTSSRMWNPGHATTRLVLVDLGGAEPRLLEDATYDARYVSARLVDGTVRLVTATTPQMVPMISTLPHADGQELVNPERMPMRPVELADVLPQVVRRDASGSVLEEGSAVSCDNTSYAPGSRGASTLLVTTFRPEDDNLRATDRDAVTTDGDLVYSSTNRLYVATSRWGTFSPMASDLTGAVAPSGEVQTQLHAFDTSDDSSTTYTGSGSVPGYIYGRWALSEHKGVLRVATTRQPPWDNANGDGETSSMVVKLAEDNGQLVETGRVSGLGRTEHIKAVRYFGEIAAVVTFRQTDPLYLIDLGENPKVLGELKIPGFSTYLHPIGDGLLLGVGHDATDQGQVTGMQVSVFDISDPTKPRQVDRLSLGQGWSPALEDSRAFTYDPEHRVAAFAMTRWEDNGVDAAPSAALGIRVGEDGTLSEVGRLRLANEEHNARVMLAGPNVFAITGTGVVAGDVASWTRTGYASWPPSMPTSEGDGTPAR